MLSKLESVIKVGSNTATQRELLFFLRFVFIFGIFRCTNAFRPSKTCKSKSNKISALTGRSGSDNGGATSPLVYQIIYMFSQTSCSMSVFVSRRRQKSSGKFDHFSEYIG